MTDYEYLESLAAELDLHGETLDGAIEELGIERLQLALPPYGSESAEAVRAQDADRLRRYRAEQLD